MPRLAFRSGGIFTINSDGSNLTRLTTFLLDRLPAWSPDGKRIAFNPGITVINIDGTGQIQLSDPQTSIGEIHWSPDGKYIAFQANDANNEVYLAVVDVATGTATIITPGRPVEAGFAWSPQ